MSCKPKPRRYRNSGVNAFHTQPSREQRYRAVKISRQSTDLRKIFCPTGHYSLSVANAVLLQIIAFGTHSHPCAIRSVFRAIAVRTEVVGQRTFHRLRIKKSSTTVHFALRQHTPDHTLTENKLWYPVSIRTTTVLFKQKPHVQGGVFIPLPRMRLCLCLTTQYGLLCCSSKSKCPGECLFTSLANTFVLDSLTTSQRQIDRFNKYHSHAVCTRRSALSLSLSLSASLTGFRLPVIYICDPTTARV